MKVATESTAYREYVDKLILLRRLIREGKCDSEQADLIRDQMDKPWHELSIVDRETADALSVDLSTLEIDSPIQHPKSGGVLTESMRQELTALLANSDWDGILQLLRSRPAETSLD